MLRNVIGSLSLEEVQAPCIEVATARVCFDRVDAHASRAVDREELTAHIERGARERELEVAEDGHLLEGGLLVELHDAGHQAVDADRHERRDALEAGEPARQPAQVRNR